MVAIPVKPSVIIHGTQVYHPGNRKSGANTFPAPRLIDVKVRDNHVNNPGPKDMQRKASKWAARTDPSAP